MNMKRFYDFISDYHIIRICGAILLLVAAILYVIFTVDHSIYKDILLMILGFLTGWNIASLLKRFCDLE